MTAPNITRYGVESACRETLSAHFNIASNTRVCVDHVALYTPDWDNLANNRFLKNADFYGVYCLLSDTLPTTQHGKASSITLTHDDSAAAWQMAALTFRPDGDVYDQRLKDVLAYARQWRDQQKDTFDEPRLIVLPEIKERVLWLSGAKTGNVIIPVDHFHTKLSDPIAVDKKYLTTLRTIIAQQEKMYEDMRKQHGDDADLLGGGAATPRNRGLRPPGG